MAWRLLSSPPVPGVDRSADHRLADGAAVCCSASPARAASWRDRCPRTGAIWGSLDRPREDLGDLMSSALSDGAPAPHSSGPLPIWRRLGQVTRAEIRSAGLQQEAGDASVEGR